MLKRTFAAIAVLVLAAMAFHGVAHAVSADHDVCTACAVGDARASASAAPRVVRVRAPALAVETPPAPSEVPARAPRPVARPPPRG